jgi:hypothetical protein
LLSTFNTQYKEINKVTETLCFNNTIKVILIDYASSFFITAADIEANLFDVSIWRTILNNENCTITIHWIPKIMFSRFAVDVVLRISIYVFIFLLDRIHQWQLFFSYDKNRIFSNALDCWTRSYEVPWLFSIFDGKLKLNCVQSTWRFACEANP